MTSPVGATSSARIRWAAIMLVVGLPWLLIYLLLLGPDMPSELVVKDRLFSARSYVDTVAIGDSRVLRLDEEEFRAHGWAFFNMGLSGMSPEDTAMSLKYALNRGTIKRVVMGVSFENMTEDVPFQFSRSYREEPFAKEDIRTFATVDQLVPGAAAPDPVNLRALVHGTVLPIDGAAPRLHMLLEACGIQSLPLTFLPNGNSAYPIIERDIARGAYDFRHARDPAIYFQRADGEAAYLRRRTLAESAKALSRKVFKSLQDAGLPCVVFETGRTSAYQGLIDADPLLRRLQTEWRDFYKSQQSRCLLFLDSGKLSGVYDPKDFFDAVHFIGGTEHNLAAMLVTELARVESGCRTP